MTTRNFINGKAPTNQVSRRYLDKSNREWELAGLARAEGDAKSASEHEKRAREYFQLAVDSNC